MKISNIIKMEVGDIVEFRCPLIFMEKKFEIRGLGVLIGHRIDKYTNCTIAFKVHWSSGEVSWEHDTYLELL